MGTNSKIEWTEATWNPVTGCTKVSQGCKHCYAETMANRLKAMGNPRYKNGFRVTLHPETLNVPIKWKRPRKVFVNSMSDLFHHDVPTNFIYEVFVSMAKAQQHIFQVLTKRPNRMAEFSSRICFITAESLSHLKTCEYPYGVSYSCNGAASDPVPLPNVWLGTSVEDKRTACERIPQLQETIATTRFLSVEPLLGPIDNLDLSGIHWVIVGGESGPKARPMNEEWVISIRDQCIEQNVPFFFKQWGGKNKKKAGRLLQGKEYNEFPQEMELDG